MPPRSAPSPNCSNNPSRSCGIGSAAAKRHRAAIGSASSMKSATVVTFDYRPSRWLVAAVIFMALLAFVAIELSGIPWWAGILAVILAAACAGFALGRFLRPLVRRAVWQQAGHWRVTDAGG